MIHGYHVTWGTYGHWLPNDPRGSWSKTVQSKALQKLGNAKKTVERSSVSTKELYQWKRISQEALEHPAVVLTGEQALEIALGFKEFILKSSLAVWAFSILPDHLHFVWGRHRYKSEVTCNLLKGAATQRLTQVGLHPFESYQMEHGVLPAIWAERQWIEYLDSEQSIDNAIRYVEDNPIRIGKKKQEWSFVTPFEGLSKGGWMSYY